MLHDFTQKFMIESVHSVLTKAPCLLPRTQQGGFRRRENKMKISVRTALQLLNFCLLPTEIETTRRNFRESVKSEEFFLVDPDAETEFYRPLISVGYRSDGVLLASNGDCLLTIRLEESPPSCENKTPGALFYASLDRKAFIDAAMYASIQSIEFIDLSSLLNADALRLLPEDNIFARLDLTEDMHCILGEGKRTEQTLTLNADYLTNICTLAATFGSNIELTIFKNSEGASRAILFSADNRFLGLVASVNTEGKQ